MHKFTIGADPEFYFAREDKEPLDAGRIITDVTSSKQFGLDGCGRVAEVRPFASEDPLEVVKNIKDCLQSGYNNNLDTQVLIWTAGEGKKGYPIGGHIHFGYDKEECDVNIQAAALVLDIFLATPCFLLEEQGRGKLRRIRGYGKVLDVRHQDHGMEYRTLSSWITSPGIATGVLCLAKVVFNEYLEGTNIPPKLIIDCGERTTCYGSCIESCEKNIMQVEENVRGFKLYGNYSDHIDPLFELIRLKKNWYPRGKDIKAAWGIA